MIVNKAHQWVIRIWLATLMAVSTGTVLAQTQFKQGFNLFSVEQDLEIGRQSSIEAERQLPILDNRSIEDYINEIGERLAAVAPGANFPYQFKIVNASDINAFALPGGYLYLNRGLIEAAQSEGQLAGVMAHEMAHVALRHGTNQASKAYMAQGGLSLLAGLLREEDHSTDQQIAAIGGFGLNTLFLKFSRAAEEQADVTGVQMMAAAGYDPADMADFFVILAQTQDREPGKVAQFFSSHPAPSNRSARINEEIALLRVNETRPVGGFAEVQSELSGMRPAPSMQQIADGQSAPSRESRPARSDRSVPEIRVEGPSDEFETYVQRDELFEIGYPSNWNVYEPAQGYGVTIAPEGGLVDAGSVEMDIVSGVIVNHYAPLADDVRDGRAYIDGDTSLVHATNDLVAHILGVNPNLDLVRDSERRSRIDGADSISVVLSGRSPVTRQEERVTVFSREIPDDHVIYALFIAPEQDYRQLNETFNRMISSLRVSNESIHDSRAELPGRSSPSGSSWLTVPAGTVLMVTFEQALSSASSQAGDRFSARVVEPVSVNGREAIATASMISGRVVSVERAGRFGDLAQLNLEFTSLRVGSGVERPISASFHGEGEAQSTRDAVLIGGAAAGGAVLGKVLGDDSESTVLGALIGGAIGTGIAARNRGEEVTIPKGVVIEIHLDAPFDR
ncbi:MAG TPA: M48 family metallopeptidase [Gammaproteobacteria bacterium]|nr:M48 family metallopeptidase [Gammaproteobacteria bacterium]